MKMTGSTILITGGTSGIGRGLAVELHRAGNTVIVAGRRADLLDALVAEHPGMAAAVVDVADPRSVTALRDTVARSHPALNVLVNMAGIMLPEDLLDPASIDVAEATIRTNLLGPLRMIHAFAPLLVGRPDAAVINVSSGLAFVPLPFTPTYSATKAALHSLTQSLRVQLAGTGVQVIELIPPAVRTPLMGQETAESAMPLEDFLAETMTLLRELPDATEIVVDRVRFLRYAEATGTHDDALALLSGHH